jgi:hypothetical protein
MKLVHIVGPESVSISWAWLPSWLGQHSGYLRQLEKKLFDRFGGVDLSPETLTQMHDFLCDTIAEDHKDIHGLKEHLQSLEQVEVGASESSDASGTEAAGN